MGTRVTETGRYALVGHYAEPALHILERMALCTDCGAVVLDIDAHDNWHDTGAARRSPTSEGDT